MKFYITIILTLLFAFSVCAQKQAEVIVTSTFLRKSPDSGAEKVQTVQKGEKITFEKAQDTNGWYYVSISNGEIKGWIRKDTVRSIAKAETVSQKPQKITSISPPVATATFVDSITPAANPTPNVVTSPAPAAETPAEDDEVLRVDTEEISLNVRVVNGSNRPVSSLNQAQFEVYEDEVLQPITSFTTAEVPVINALVIDNSRSLRSQLKKVIEAGKIIVGTNRPKDESTIVRFISKDKIEVVQDFTPNKSSLNDALDNLFVEGGQTAIVDAVYRTAKKVEQYQPSQKKEDAKLRALILVSDGDDRGSSYQEQQLFEFLRESQVQIYAVGFINDLSKEIDPTSGISRQEKAKTFLTRLAQETGGRVYFPNSIDELSQIASEISGEQRTQYLISYAPTNEKRDGTFRKIKVVVAAGANKEKRIAITRTGRNSLSK
jgi:Ca-activated chloride channel family protein